MTGLEYQSVVVPVMDLINSIPGAKAINVRGSIYTERGTPDVIGCIGGRFVAFECKKTDRDDPTPIQLWRLSEWRTAGAVAHWVSSVEEAEDILRENGLI